MFQVLTKDSVTVSVDAVVYYRVSNPTISVANVENAHHSTRLLAQTTLRNILGTKNMSEILSDRESISHGMQVLHGSGKKEYYLLLILMIVLTRWVNGHITFSGAITLPSSYTCFDRMHLS